MKKQAKSIGSDCRAGRDRSDTSSGRKTEETVAQSESISGKADSEQTPWRALQSSPFKT